VIAGIAAARSAFLWFAYHGQQEQVMKNTLSTLGLATVLLTGVAASGFAAGGGAQPSQSVTETQTGSQQLGRPATGNQVSPGSYGMNTTTGGTMTYSGQAGPNAGVAQSSPDAAHPTVPSPSGGGANDSGGSSH
jgi:hypothetical protein